MWEVESGQWVREFGRYHNDISSIAFSPDGQMVATGTHFGRIRLWNTQTGEAIREFQTDTGTITRLIFSPDSQYIILLGLNTYSATFWHTDTGERVKMLGGYNDAMSDIALSPDGHYLLVAGMGTWGKLWEVETGQEIRSFDRLERVGFSADGHYALTVARGDTLQVWSVETWTVVSTTAYGDGISLLDFSSDGRYALIRNTNTMGERTHVSLWSLEMGESIRTVAQSTEEIRKVIFSPDNRYVLTSSLNPSGDGSVWLWSVETGQPVRQISGPGAPPPCRTRILGICL